jgi:hypothetical protein
MTTWHSCGIMSPASPSRCLKRWSSATSTRLFSGGAAGARPASGREDHAGPCSSFWRARRTRLFQAGFQGRNKSLSNLTHLLEGIANVPVIDETRLTNRFDFDLNCRRTDLENRDWDRANQALAPLGLELIRVICLLKCSWLKKRRIKNSLALFSGGGHLCVDAGNG